MKLDLPREITLRLSTTDGCLVIRSDDVLGLYMASKDHDAVFADLPEVLGDLIQHNGLK